MKRTYILVPFIIAACGDGSDIEFTADSVTTEIYAVTDSAGRTTSMVELKFDNTRRILFEMPSGSAGEMTVDVRIVQEAGMERSSCNLFVHSEAELSVTSCDNGRIAAPIDVSIPAVSEQIPVKLAQVSYGTTDKSQCSSCFDGCETDRYVRYWMCGQNHTPNPPSSEYKRCIEEAEVEYSYCRSECNIRQPAAC